MTRLRSKLLGLNKNKPADAKTKVFSPPNCEELRIPIRTEKTAKVVGKLAERLAPFHDLDKPADGESGDERRQHAGEEGELVSAVLVQNDLKLSLMAPEDLREYAGLTTTTITCRQKITLASASIELIRWALEGTFGGIKNLTTQTNGTGTQTNGHTKDGNQEAADEEIDRTEYKFLVMDTVTVSYRQQGAMELEWEGNMMNDGIADAVMAVLLTVESSPAAVRRTFSHLVHPFAPTPFMPPSPLLLPLTLAGLLTRPRILKTPLTLPLPLPHQRHPNQWQLPSKSERHVSPPPPQSPRKHHSRAKALTPPPLPRISIRNRRNNTARAPEVHHISFPSYCPCLCRIDQTRDRNGNRDGHRPKSPLI